MPFLQVHFWVQCADSLLPWKKESLHSLVYLTLQPVTAAAAEDF